MSPCYVIKRKSFTKTCDIDKNLKLILSGKNCRTATIFLVSMLNNFSDNKVTITFYQIKNMLKLKMLLSRKTKVIRKSCNFFLFFFFFFCSNTVTELYECKLHVNTAWEKVLDNVSKTNSFLAQSFVAQSSFTLDFWFSHSQFNLSLICQKESSIKRYCTEKQTVTFWIPTNKLIS